MYMSEDLLEFIGSGVGEDIRDTVDLLGQFLDLCPRYPYQLVGIFSISLT